MNKNLKIILLLSVSIILVSTEGSYADRELMIPLLRTRLDSGGSECVTRTSACDVVEVTSHKFPVPPMYLSSQGGYAMKPKHAPLSGCQIRNRYEFQNLSSLQQPITVSLRAGSWFEAYFNSWGGIGPSTTLFRFDQALASFTLQPKGNSNDAMTVMIDWTCILSGRNTGTCTLTAPSYSQAFILSAFDSHINFYRDLTCSQATGINVTIHNDRGAVSGLMVPLANRQGGYNHDIYGASTVMLNGGRPF